MTSANQSRRFGRLVLNLNVGEQNESIILPALATPQKLAQAEEVAFPCSKRLIKRQQSLKIIENLRGSSHMNASETEGHWLKSSVKQFKSSFEENKALLSLILSDQSVPIDLLNPAVSKLVADAVNKAIKTKQERTLIGRVIVEKCTLLSTKKQEEIADELEVIVDEIKCDSFDSKDVVYETGDFGQDSFLVLSGEFSQLVPTSEELISSPTKLTRHALKNLPPHPLSQYQQSKKDENAFASLEHKRSLKSGDSFGETELLARKRRQCTIICESRGCLMRISKESFTKLIGESMNEIIRNKVEFLSQFPFFEGVSNAKLMALAECGKMERYHSTRSVIYEEGDADDSVYFIVSGQVQISKQVAPEESQNATAGSLNASEDESNTASTSKIVQNRGNLLKIKVGKRKSRNSKVPISVLSENGYFGFEEVIAEQTNRSFTATSISENSQILVFSAKGFLKMVDNYGHIDILKSSIKSREEYWKERIESMSEQKSSTNWTMQSQQFQQQSQPQSQQQQQQQQIPGLGLFKTSSSNAISIDLSNRLNSSHSNSTFTSLSPKNSQKQITLPFSTRPRTPNSSSGLGVQLPSIQSKFATVASQSSTVLSGTNAPVTATSASASSHASGFGSVAAAAGLHFGKARSSAAVVLSSEEIPEVAGGPNNEIQMSMGRRKTSIAKSLPRSDKKKSEKQSLSTSISPKEGDQQTSQNPPPAIIIQKQLRTGGNIVPASIFSNPSMSSANKIDVEDAQQSLKTPRGTSSFASHLQLIKQEGRKGMQFSMSTEYLHKSQQHRQTQSYFQPSQLNQQQPQLKGQNSQGMSDIRKPLHSQQGQQFQTEMQQEMQKTLFSSFVRETEDKLQKKQDILAKIKQNCNSVDRNSTNGTLFDKEFQEGFNQMYLRKFGKKYVQK